jgi:hypothetical protein
MTGVLLGRGCTDTHPKQKACEVGGRDWSHEPGRSRIARSHQELEETRKDSSLPPWEEYSPADTSISDS